jgi:hypothetical protein
MARPSLASALLILVVFAACEKPLPEKPQLITDVDSIGFGQEFGSGTFIGTSAQRSLQIFNGGLTPLNIQSTTMTGNDVDAFVVEQPLKTMVKGQETTFMRFFFQPKQARVYSATLTIISDAENAPNKQIAISGRGINPDGGM